ncbi:hypothetical protein [Streptomyces sp. 8ZJF_21]|nr:hypothetical protein [Streptomyces sp. 8ZJF_21]
MGVAEHDANVADGGQTLVGHITMEPRGGELGGPSRAEGLKTS